jgi:hypothetical protein
VKTRAVSGVGAALRVESNGLGLGEALRKGGGRLIYEGSSGVGAGLMMGQNGRGGGGLPRAAIGPPSISRAGPCWPTG